MKGDSLETPGDESTPKRVSAALFSQHLIEGLDIGNIRWVVRRVAEIEGQLSEKGSMLNFERCEGIKSMVHDTIDRLRGVGRREEAESLTQTFGRYFPL